MDAETALYVCRTVNPGGYARCLEGRWDLGSGRHVSGCDQMHKVPEFRTRDHKLLVFCLGIATVGDRRRIPTYFSRIEPAEALEKAPEYGGYVVEHDHPAYYRHCAGSEMPNCVDWYPVPAEVPFQVAAL